MRDQRKCIGWIGTMLGGLLFLHPTFAAAAQGPRVHALTGVRIVVSPEREITSGTVVLRDGIIESVSESAEAPPDARIWSEEGLTVYPGLIEPYSVLPWPEADDDAQPQGGHTNSLVRPHRDMTSYGFDEDLAASLRAAGFTAAVMAPRPGLFRGRSILVALGEGSVRENLLAREIAQNVTLRTQAEDGYPGSLMGSIALFRQTLLDATWYRNAQMAYQRNPAQSRPPFDHSLEALASAAAGEERIVFESGDLLDTLRTVELSRELGLKAWLVASGEEYKRPRKLVESGMPLLVTVDFPEAPEAGDDDDLTVDLEELRHWDQAPDNPRTLLEAGSTIAFTSYRLSQPSDLHGHLETAVSRGLEPAAVLAALTTTPARLLSMSDQMGTVEAGKMANLVVVEGDLFVDKPKIRSVWVDGNHFPVKEIEPPEIDPAGTWSIEIDAGEIGRLTVSLELIGEPDSLEGFITTPAGRSPLTSVIVSGKSLEAVYESPMLGTVTFNLSGSDDTLSGNGTSDRGSFKAKARRTSKPDPEVAP